MYGLQLWNKVLSDQAIADLPISCPAANSEGETNGNVLTWADFKHGLHGGVVIGESPFCRGCPDPVSPIHGIVHVSSPTNEAVYTCHTGYILAPSSWTTPNSNAATTGGGGGTGQSPGDGNNGEKNRATTMRRRCMVIPFLPSFFSYIKLI